MNIEINLKYKFYVKEDNKIVPVTRFSFENVFPDIEIQDGICFLQYRGIYHELTETPEEIEEMRERFLKEERERLSRSRTKEQEDELWKRNDLDPINN